MKKNTLTIILYFTIISSFSQNTQIQPKVDERTELLSIVFRLAEAKEFVNNGVDIYAKDIDQYFEPFKNHKLITFVKKIRETNSIGYDAVMSMAINLEIDRCINLKKNISKESLDQRWGDYSQTFIELLNQFYVDTKFHSFHENHQSLYLQIERNFGIILEELDLEWFEEFFGFAPSGSLNIILSVSNGRNCYGPSSVNKDGKEDIYAIMGYTRVDSLGVPSYTSSLIPFVIHEFCHSYCNPIINSNYDEMESQASKIFSLVSSKMKDQAYGSPKTMLNEMLVRACVIKYSKDHNAGNEKIQGMIINEKNRGFLWMEDLINCLSNYEDNKEKYGSLNDFFPEVVTLQNSASLEYLLADYKDKCPQIISSNIIDGDNDVDPSIKFISLKFDKRMVPFYYGTSDGRKGENFYPDSPEDSKIEWDESFMEFFLPVSLKPDTQYSISFPDVFFKDEEGYLLRETYYLDFKTK